MDLNEAQQEMRRHFAGGLYGQAVSGLLWLASAVLATWGSPRNAIVTLVAGGFLIFPATKLLVGMSRSSVPLSVSNSLPALGMQVAFVLPLSMPLLVPVGLYRLELFYPGMMILLGAHYVPFVFLYGMPLFAALAAALVGGGVVIALYFSSSFSVGAWYTAAVLLAFAIAGRAVAASQPGAGSTPPPGRDDGAHRGVAGS